MKDKQRFTAKTRQEWRSWLTDNYAQNEGIWLITYKKNSGMPYLSYPSSVTFRDRSLRRENYSDFSDLVFIIRKKSVNSCLDKGSRFFK